MYFLQLLGFACLAISDVMAQPYIKIKHWRHHAIFGSRDMTGEKQVQHHECPFDHAEHVKACK